MTTSSDAVAMTQNEIIAAIGDLPEAQRQRFIEALRMLLDGLQSLERWFDETPPAKARTVLMTTALWANELRRLFALFTP